MKGGDRVQPPVGRSWLVRLQTLPPRRKLALVAAALSGYLLGAAWLYPVTGPSAALLAVVPVLGSAALWGLRVGLLAGALSFPFNLLLLYLTVPAGDPGDLAAWDDIGIVAMALTAAGAVAGHLADAARDAPRRADGQPPSEGEPDFRTLVERGGGAVVLVDADGTILYASPAAVRLSGYSAAETVGRDAFESGVVHGEDIEPARQQFVDLLAQPGSSVTAHYRRRHQDGSWRWVEAISTNLHPGPGAGAVAIYYRDVTEDRLSEEQLRLLSRAVESSPASVMITNPAGEIQYVNAKFTELTGYSLGEVLGRNPRLLKSGNMPPEGYRHLWETITSGGQWTGEFENRKKNGEPFWELASISPVTDEQGRITHFVAVKEDITQRKRAERAVRESETMLASIHNLMPVGIALADEQGLLVEVNDAYCRLYRYTREELIGQPMTIVSPPEEVEAAEAAYARILSGDPTVPAERRRRRKDGAIIYVEAANSVVQREGGRRLVITVANDITRRKQRERELQALVTVSAALRTAATRAEMLPVILDQVLDLVKTGDAALILPDPVTGEAVMELARGPSGATFTGLRLPPGAGVTGQVIATGQPYVTDDAPNDPDLLWPHLLGENRAVAVIPLIARDVTIGALWVRRPSAYGEDEIRLLTAIADITANAIRRATLHELTERRLRRLQGVRAVDLAITGSLDLRVTLNILLDQITAQLGVDAAAVLLLSPDSQMLEYAAGRGFRTRVIERSRVRLGEGHTGRAGLERRTVGIADVQQSGRDFLRADILAAEDIVAYYGVPLVTKGQVKGVLDIFHRAPIEADREWLEFLETLAGQAAIAIENTQLFEGLQRSSAELALAYDATLAGWSRALDLRDRETEGHTQRVTEMTERLARAVGIGEADLVHVRRGALLHDIGKMGIPDSILHKSGPLTPQEWDIMRLHPAYAFGLLSPIAHLRPALDIPYCHHEKWDGTGYPRGLKGEQIPLAARLFAVVDVWDALRSDRPYRPAWPDGEVLDHIRKQAGKHFDPKVVELFLVMVA